MIQLAINYSHEAASLLSQGKLSVDRFKTPDWPDIIEEASRNCQVAVHFDLFTANRSLRTTDWARCEAIMEATRTPYLNLHLSAERVDFPKFPVHAPKKRQSNRVLEKLLTDVQAVVSHIGKERVIVENIPYRGESEDILRPPTEPRVIRQIVEETGCGFLLDLSHARISACYLGYDEYQYLSELPMHSMREMHFTGLDWINGKLKDHRPALPGDFRMLSWAFTRIKQGDWPTPWLLAFEYGGVGDKYLGRTDADVIAEQMPILADIISIAG